MKASTKKLCLILVTILSYSLQASLNEPNLPDPSFQNPFISTVHGAVMAYAGRIRNLQSKYQNYQSLPSNHFEIGSTKVLLFNQNTKADLVIALPGIATKNFSPMMSRPLDYFSNRGYHTAVINNPWSHTYLIQKPDHWPGDIEAEAEVVLDLIPEIIKKIGVQNVKHIHLYGESYGGFLSSVVKGLDKNNLIDGKILMVGPPINFKSSANNLDQLIVRAQNLPENKPGNLELLGIMFGFLWENLRGKTPKVNEDQMLQVVSIDVFLKHLKQTLKDLKYIGGSNVPESINLKDPRYYSYIDSVSKNFRVKNPQSFSLFYWLNKLQSKNVDFQVISAQDDFLNIGEVWNLANSQKSISILSWGGHLGFTGFKWWEEVLDKKFGSRLPGSEAPACIGFEAPIWNDPKMSKTFRAHDFSF